MRCSSCEILLDRYVEGTLPPHQMSAISRHLASCPSCEALLTEVRVVDALLATTKPIELAPNFTFAVMAEARTIAAPKRRVAIHWPILVFYLVGAWLAACAALMLGTIAPLRAALAPVFATLGNAFAAIAGIVHGFGPAAPFAIGWGIAILLFDVALCVGVVFLYRAIRPRLTERLNHSEAS